MKRRSKNRGEVYFMPLNFNLRHKLRNILRGSPVAPAGVEQLAMLDNSPTLANVKADIEYSEAVWDKHSKLFLIQFWSDNKYLHYSHPTSS